MRVFDLETYPQLRSLELQPTESDLVKGIKPNFKPDTVEAYRAKNAEEFSTKMLKRASIDWRLGQIGAYVVVTEGQRTPLKASVGIVGDADLTVGESNEQTLSVETGIRERMGATNGEVELAVWCYQSESTLLETLFILLGDDCQIGGFGIRDFDIPWLLFRGMLHGWTLDRERLRMSRYTPSDVVDMADVLGWYGHFQSDGWDLGRYCSWFGLPYQPRGSGSDVLAWKAAGDFVSIGEHVLYDGLAAYSLWKKFEAALRTMG